MFFIFSTPPLFAYFPLSSRAKRSFSHFYYVERENPANTPPFGCTILYLEQWLFYIITPLLRNKS